MGGDIKFSGFAAFDWYQYFVEVGDRAPDGAKAVGGVAQIRLAPRLQATYRSLRAVAEVEFRHDFLDPGRANRFILREAAIGFRYRGLHVEGGALLPRWGKMDVDSPSDNLVARDYEEFLFPDPLPVPAVSVGWSGGPFSVTGLLIPAFVPSRYRNTEPSRWNNTWFLPRTETVPTGIVGDYVFTNRYGPFVDAVAEGGGSPLLRGVEAGVRADLYLRALDLGLSFATVRDRLPTWTSFEVTNTNVVDGVADYLQNQQVDLEITPHHERLYVPAVDMALSVWRLVLKGEAAYFHTQDPDHDDCLIDDPYVKYAVGAELVLPDLLGPVDLAVRVQYNGDVEIPREGDDILNQERGCKVFSIADPDQGLTLTDRETGQTGTPAIRHPYSHAWYWNLNLAFSDSFSLDLRGFADVSQDALIWADLSYRLLDTIEFHLGALVMLSTGEDTVFTPYGNNHRLEVGLRYRF
ncbi:MAG TPA: hypothetical protein DIU15_04680 [Deltaproteobacteria bacterium]|nr:hypothetical protein [Deltaproteobacteria bacterium]